MKKNALIRADTNLTTPKMAVFSSFSEEPVKLSREKNLGA